LKFGTGTDHSFLRHREVGRAKDLSAPPRIFYILHYTTTETQRGYLTQKIINTIEGPPLWRCGPTWAMASSFLTFLYHTQHPKKSLGLLSTRDQLVAETSTWQHTAFTTDRYPCPRWNSNPQFQQASYRRPTP